MDQFSSNQQQNDHRAILHIHIIRYILPAEMCHF